MKITKLDSFGEGFRVAPRKPHRETRTLGKPLTRAERKMRIIDVCIGRLEKEGFCYTSCFQSKRNKRSALDSMWRMNRAGTMNLEKVFDDEGLIIGYKVIKQ